MPVHRLRPRFELPVSMNAVAAFDLLRRRLEEPGCPCRGLLADQHRHVDLRVPHEERHAWSPALSMEIREGAAGGAVIHGLVGPNPAIWTMVAFAYLAFATAAAFLLTFGGVQLLLDESPWALWLGGLALLLVAAVWIASRVGQRLAAPQTAMLRRFLEDAFELGAAEMAESDRDPDRK